MVGESEKRLAELFRMARSISPCFILLDNIEVILGTPAATTDASRGAPVSMGKRHRTRTTHKAIDRILSTLLMEIDGIEDPAERKDHMEDSHGEGGGGGRGQVIVIATMSNHPKHLDRCAVCVYVCVCVYVFTVCTVTFYLYILLQICRHMACLLSFQCVDSTWKAGRAYWT